MEEEHEKKRTTATPYVDDDDLAAPTGTSLPASAGATFATLPSVVLFVHGRTWAALVLAVSATSILAAIYMTVVLLSRCCDGTLRPVTQTLSFLLLFSIIAQLSSVCLFVLPTGNIRQQLFVASAALKLFLPPLCCAAVFALLLAKLLEFRNLASAGLGGSVPQCPLYMAVILAVAVQAAVSAHFFTAQHLQLVEDSDDSAFHLPLLYLHVTVLAVVTASYAITLRQIRSKQKEAQLILVASLASSLLLLLWALAVAVLFPRDYHDALTALMVVLLAITVLGSVFVPRVVQLNRQRTLLDAKSTYACNIRRGVTNAAAAASRRHHQQLPVSPWLDCTFACQAGGKFKYSPPPAAPQLQSMSTRLQQQHLGNTANASTLLAGPRSLLRHPAYSGNYSGKHLN